MRWARGRTTPPRHGRLNDVSVRSAAETPPAVNSGHTATLPTETGGSRIVLAATRTLGGSLTCFPRIDLVLIDSPVPGQRRRSMKSRFMSSRFRIPRQRLASSSTRDRMWRRSGSTAVVSDAYPEARLVCQDAADMVGAYPWPRDTEILAHPALQPRNRLVNHSLPRVLH